MKTSYIRRVRFVVLALVITNMVTSGSFANEVQFIDIKIEQSYLNEIDFYKQFGFIDDNTIRYTNLRIDNKLTTLEWSPDAKQLMLSNIWFGKKPKGREIRGDFEYRFIIINQEKNTIRPYKIPVQGWDHSTNLSWFSDKEIAILGVVENNRLNVNATEKNIVIIDLSTGQYRNMRLPAVNHQEIGCVDFIEQIFFNIFTNQILVRFYDSQACAHRSGTILFSKDDSGKYNAKNFEEYPFPFTAISLSEGLILNGKFIENRRQSLAPSKYEKIYGYCEIRNNCGFNKKLQYAQLIKNAIKLGKYSNKIPNLMSNNKLETPNYIVQIYSNCDSGRDTCNSFSYVGTSKRTGSSITLTGRSVEANCASKPCGRAGYIFNKNNYIYQVNELGQLKVTKRIPLENKQVRVETLVEEDGEWK